MAQFPSFPLWTDAYLGDTTHLTTTEHGAYLLLLIAMWRSSDGTLPNDDRRLARFAKLTPTQWTRIKPTIMEFMTVENGRVSQGRLTDELILVRQHSRQQSDKARSRWLKEKNNGDATAMPEACQSDAPTPTPTITEEDKSSSGATSAPTLEKLIYDQGKAILGSAGQVTNLRKAFDKDDAQVWAILQEAKTKDGPAAWLAGVINRRANAQSSLLPDANGLSGRNRMHPGAGG